MGLTEAPRRKAQETARRVVGAGGATAVQLQALAEELVSTSAANREALAKLVRFEVERALGAVGLATADEVTELTRRVRELERQLREAATGSATTLAASDTVADVDAVHSTDVDAVHPFAPGGAAEPAVSPLTAPPTAAADPSSGTTVTAASPAKQTRAKKTVAKQTPAKQTPAKQTPAKQAVGKRAVGKRAVAKKAPGKQQPGGPE
ncbi:phasin family protein [Salinispora sp. H7-4]|uniref:phasin family protein n=1 Tax=Salinispora sp. H7-4 TaxID=2748321 RepID=UPI0015D3F9FD|nr:hypothetical protein [Salinispora sp. H7-4]NYT94316.1 hypothetical protein [Salinispora sp. H7-4]